MRSIDWESDNGTADLPDPYPITRRLIDEGRDHLLLERPIPLALPVRILLGMLDDDVPWQLSLTLAEKIASDDVRVVFVKDGDHRLSNDGDLDLLCRTVDEVGGMIAT